jgi:hypothetical protein
VIRCANVNLEFLVDAEECARRGIDSMIAAPVYHAGSVAGALELYYGADHSFTEPDVHTCQLMAGLVAEAMARNEELTSKKSIEAERAAMRDALEKLKPNLEALVEKPASKESASKTVSASSLAALAVVCRKCGNELVKEEQFCGKCGSPRSGDYEPPSMQTKVAQLWQMQEAKKNTDGAVPGNGASGAQRATTDFDPFPPDGLSSDSLDSELPELFSFPDPLKDHGALPEEMTKLLPAIGTADSQLAVAGPAPHETAEKQTALAGPELRPNWSSAIAAREFLEKLAKKNDHSALIRFLKARRGDIYLAVAVILAACVIRWGIWSDASSSASTPAAAMAHHKTAADADLSPFDRMLIKLGLAEAPDPPEYKGNPDTMVWIDVQTALYYCPGTDLYGKTPKGRLSSQRDAQLDQFEPAARKACD